MKVTWITLITVLYFEVVALYVFQDDRQIWDTYFNLVNTFMNVFLGICILQIARGYEMNIKEYGTIAYIVAYRAICFIWLLIISLFGIETKEYPVVTFLSVLSVSGFVAWRYTSSKYETVKL